MTATGSRPWCGARLPALRVQFKAGTTSRAMSGQHSPCIGVHKQRYQVPNNDVALTTAAFNPLLFSFASQGYDFLAIHALVSRGAIAGVGRKLGVGKESDVYEVSVNMAQPPCLGMVLTLGVPMCR